MDKGGTQTNEPKGEDLNNYDQGITCERWRKQGVCIKKRKRNGLASIEDCLDASIPDSKTLSRAKKTNYSSR